MINFAPVGQQAEAQSTGVPQAKKPDLAHLKRQIVQTTSEAVEHTQTATAQAPAQTASDQAIKQEKPAVPESASTAPDNDFIPDVGEELTPPAAAPLENPEPSQVTAPQSDEVDVPWDTSDDPEPAAPQEMPATAPAPEIIEQPVQEIPAVQPNVIDTIVGQQPEASEPAQLESAPVAPVQAEQSSEEQPVSVAKPEIKEEKPQADYSDLLAMPLNSTSWPLIFNALPVEGMLRNLVANTCLMQVDGEQLVFHSDAGHMRLFGEAHQKRFAEVLNETLSSQYRVQVLEGVIQYETPAQRSQRLQQERLQQAIASIEQDPNVQALRQAFDAQVIMDSITPIETT